jgi:hypothetical protein
MSWVVSRPIPYDRKGQMARKVVEQHLDFFLFFVAAKFPHYFAKTF